MQKRKGFYCPPCHYARYSPLNRSPNSDPLPCKWCGDPLTVRAGWRLYHPRCAYLRYGAPYEAKVLEEGGERAAVYKKVRSRINKVYWSRRQVGLRSAFRYLLPGKKNADPRQEPWSLGWLERLYDLCPGPMHSAASIPRTNPAYSLAIRDAPELRRLLDPMVNPANPLAVEPPRTLRDLKRLARAWLDDE